MSTNRDDALLRLSEEVARRREAGEPLDADELCESIGLSRETVSEFLEGIHALAGGLAQDTTPELPRPEMPEGLELMEELGRGGMAVVYRARQESLDRDVAVKVMMPSELVFGEALRRFRREARAMAKLRHPNVVSIHSVGEANGFVYLVMDLYGESLRDLLKSKSRPMPVARIVRLLEQVAQAVAYIHGHGLVHRDLKPANVLLDAAGDAHVADFGLVLDPSEGATVTQSGNILGTPDYMAPEQAVGDRARVDERTDVYALGVMLYACLAGRTPFEGLSLVDKLTAVANDEPPPPSHFAPATPRALDHVCAKAMAKKPEGRYSTASALAEDLGRFRRGEPVQARGVRPMARLRTWIRRRPVRTAAGLAMIAFLLTLAVRFVGPGFNSPAQRLADAERLWKRGEPRAAELFYLEGLAAGPGDPRVAYGLGFGAVRAALSAGDLEIAGERLASLEQEFAGSQLALEDLDVTLGLWLLESTHARLRGEDWSCAALVGDYFDFGKRTGAWEFEVDWSLLESAIRRQFESDPGELSTALAAIAEVAAVYAGPADEFADFEWVLRHPDRHYLADWHRDQGLAAGVLVPLAVESIDELPDVGARYFIAYCLGGALGEFAHSTAGRNRLSEQLDRIQDESEDETIRALAIGTLAAGFDLPFQLEVSAEGSIISDDGQLERATRLWREVAGKSLERRLETAAAHAIQTLDDQSDSCRDRTLGWLQRHAASDIEDSDAWRQWWSAHAEDGPERWLSESLGLDSTATNLTLFQGLQSERDLVRKHRWHELLKLRFFGGDDPDPRDAPSWPLRKSESVPASLVHEWARFIGEDALPPLRLRMAIGILNRGEGELQLFDEFDVEVADSAAGGAGTQEFVRTFDVPRELQRESDDGRPLVPLSGKPTVAPESGRLGLRFKAAFDGGAPCLVVDVNQFYWRPSGSRRGGAVRDRTHRSDPDDPSYRDNFGTLFGDGYRIPHDRVCAVLIEDLIHGSEAPHRLVVLAYALPCIEAAELPHGVDEWRERIVRSIMGAPGPTGASDELTVLAAGFLPDPRVVGAISRVDSTRWRDPMWKDDAGYPYARIDETRAAFQRWSEEGGAVPSATWQPRGGVIDHRPTALRPAWDWLTLAALGFLAGIVLFRGLLKVVHVEVVFLLLSGASLALLESSRSSEGVRLATPWIRSPWLVDSWPSEATLRLEPLAWGIAVATAHLLSRLWKKGRYAAPLLAAALAMRFAQGMWGIALLAPIAVSVVIAAILAHPLGSRPAKLVASAILLPTLLASCSEQLRLWSLADRLWSFTPSKGLVFVVWLMLWGSAYADGSESERARAARVRTRANRRGSTRGGVGPDHDDRAAHAGATGRQ